MHTYPGGIHAYTDGASGAATARGRAGKNERRVKAARVQSPRRRVQSSRRSRIAAVAVLPWHTAVVSARTTQVFTDHGCLVALGSSESGRHVRPVGVWTAQVITAAPPYKPPGNPRDLHVKTCACRRDFFSSKKHRYIHVQYMCSITVLCRNLKSSPEAHTPHVCNILVLGPAPGALQMGLVIRAREYPVHFVARQLLLFRSKSQYIYMPVWIHLAVT